MTMPGFVFHFRCDACNANSDEYSVYVFNDLVRSDVGLPAWSLTHKCWATILAHLDSDQRRAMDSDRDELLSFAASLSSDNITVGVPELSAHELGSFNVKVTPDPICPYCSARCRTPFGYPPQVEAPETLFSAAELRSAPIALIGLSVRVRNICRELCIATVGELENARSRFVAHRAASEGAVQEVDGRPKGDKIERLVQAGYIVRTRADANLREARGNDTQRRDDALDSGAHIVTTDFPAGEAHPTTGYVVHLPEHAAARVNPSSGPERLRGRTINE